jgi:hypothetical protein
MRISFFILTWLTPVLLALCAVSCRIAGPLGTSERVLHEWHDDGGPGRVSVRISLPDQIAEFARGGRYIGWCYVATGKPGHGTSPGCYQISEKIVNKVSSYYGLIEDASGNVINGDATPGTRVPKGMVYVPAPMPYWMRLTSYGVGMHGGLIPEPGKPASHGCIRMPKDFAPVLFDAVELGASVTITEAKSRRAAQIASVPESRKTPWIGGRRVISTRLLGNHQNNR